MKLNRQSNVPRPRTHEGAEGPRLSIENQLRRSVMACMLWEDEFYESGETIAERIGRLAREVNPQAVSEIAIEAREEQHLRHVPLLLTAHLAGFAAGSSLVSNTLARVIQRADEMAEFLTIYAKVNGVAPDGLKPVLSNQVRKGLARAFTKFDAYQLAKYDQDGGAVKMRDVLFLCHAKPQDEAQAKLWDQLIDGTLAPPDTWEVELSRKGQGAHDTPDGKRDEVAWNLTKRQTFTRLLKDQKLGYMALLRNLRNMVEAEVDEGLIAEAIRARRGNAHRVLPFRYIAAARAVPQLEPHLDAAMLAAQDEQPQWPGRTAILVDVSGSMHDPLSAKSDMRRMDAACALAALIPTESKRVFSFSQQVVEVPPRRGMAMVDAIKRSQLHSRTFLGAAIAAICEQVPHDRLIVVTDEQSHDRVGDPAHPKSSWMVNIASKQNGVGYESGWQRVHGWSESVIRYITAVEGVDDLR